MVKRRIRYGWHRLGIAFVGFAVLMSVPAAIAQEAVMVMPAGAQPVSPEQAKAMMEAQQAAAKAGAQPPGAQPPAEAKKDGEKKEGEGEKKDEKPPESVKRPEKPPRPADPADFKITVDEHGHVPPFNFIGQPWPDVLQWLATNMKASLDYQELPNDYINFTTQRPYTLAEVLDELNRLLNARGYTAIHAGEILSVFKLDKLDPSLIRRVSDDELYDLKPHDFVKISFELPAGMEVEKAKEDVKQVLSPNAKVFPLVTTKRLLIMDSVANLRLVSALLNEERSLQNGRVVPDEIPLKYARAEKVIDILYVVLGLDPNSRPTQMELQLQQQKLQLMTQMQQQGKDVLSMLKKDGPPVYLAFNRQRNSIIANAPPEQMKIIKQTIQYLDVPFGEAGSASAADVSAVSGQQRTTKKYPLTTLDPENFIQTLEEIGELSPSAGFRVDKKSKTLFATATEADHAKINGLIDQFDGTGRDFYVVQLRRHPADAVAATIFNLMGGQEEKEENNNNRRYYYYDPWEQNQDDDDNKPIKGFGVTADVENNRLMLWANDAEMVRVRGLLAKLGETPDGKADSRPVRFVQPGEVPMDQLLERIKEAWSASGNNELIIKVPPAAKKPTVKEVTPSEEKKDDAAKPANDRAAAVETATGLRAHFAQFELGESAPAAASTPAGTTETTAQQAPVNQPAAPAAAEGEDDDAAAVAKPAPVTISVTEDGRIMISSPDAAAADRMEELIGQLSPPEKRFKVYALKHIPAVHMYLDLKDYFADDLKEANDGYTRDWYGFMVPKGEKDNSIGLAKRRKLMLTYDEPSNSILVSNASASQIAEIEQLIAQFDKPAPTDSVEIRETKPVKIKFSRASLIANAVKEVYRDLLSSRDKEFDRGGDQRQQRASQERVTVINYGGSDSGSGGSGGKRSAIKAGFEGALSIAADDVSNVIIVSAQRGIFEDVVRMIQELDEQAAPDTVVRVHRIGGSVSAEALQNTLQSAISRPWLGGKPEQEVGRGRGDRGRRGEGDRDRDRRGRRNRGGDNDNNGNNGNGNNNND